MKKYSTPIALILALLYLASLNFGFFVTANELNWRLSFLIWGFLSNAVVIIFFLLLSYFIWVRRKGKGIEVSLLCMILCLLGGVTLVGVADSVGDSLFKRGVDSGSAVIVKYQGYSGFPYSLRAKFDDNSEGVILKISDGFKERGTLNGDNIAWVSDDRGYRWEDADYSADIEFNGFMLIILGAGFGFFTFFSYIKRVWLKR